MKLTNHRPQVQATCCEPKFKSKSRMQDASREFSRPDFFSLLPKKDQTNRNNRKISTNQETLKIPVGKTLDFRAYIGKSRRRALQPDQPNRIVQAVEKIAQNLVPARIPRLNQNIEIKIRHKPTAKK